MLKIARIPCCSTSVGDPKRVERRAIMEEHRAIFLFEDLRPGASFRDLLDNLDEYVFRKDLIAGPFHFLENCTLEIYVFRSFFLVSVRGAKLTVQCGK